MEGVLTDSMFPNARARLNLVFLSLFLGIVFLLGGASRADVLTQPFVRVAAIVLVVICALQMDGGGWRTVRAPVLFLLGIALAIGIQLVPLPYDLWAALPGRARYAEALAAAQIPQVWRPISMTPDLTLNSLLAVLPPFAAVVAFAALNGQDRRSLVPILLIGIALSAVLGVLQISSGSLYFYLVTNNDSAVGVFSNRNHQALLLATALPLLVAWATSPAADPAYRRVRRWLALCSAAAIFPILLVTGSRSGLALGVAGALAALVLAAFERKKRGGGVVVGGGAKRVLAWLIPLLMVAAAILVTVLVSRDEALRRFLENSGPESRSELLPTFFQMARDFFPTGAGFGAFDSMFRSYETNEALQYAYLNHAHNDLAQIVIEGGVLPLLLLAVFLIWFVARIIRLWFRDSPSSARLLGRTGSIVIALILGSSLVDYPLRTPLMAVLMALMCMLMLPSRPPPPGPEAT